MPIRHRPFFIQNLDDFLLEPHDLAGLIEMTIDTADIFGSDQIGIHVASIGQYVFHPPELTKPVKEKIDSVIGLESVETLDWWLKSNWCLIGRKLQWDGSCRYRY